MKKSLFFGLISTSLLGFGIIPIVSCSSTEIVNEEVSKTKDFKFTDDGTIQDYIGKSKDVVIPKYIENANGKSVRITKIDKDAFRGKALTSVVIPDSVTKIDQRAFEDNKLTSITIPNSVNEIYSYAFNKNSLTSVIFPDTIKDISVLAFAENPNLKSVTLPKNCSYIVGSRWASFPEGCKVNGGIGTPEKEPTL